MNSTLDFSVTNDIVFKKIFGSDKEILINFICPIIGIKEEEVLDLEYLDKEMTGDFYDSKIGIMDIRVRLNNNLHINVEMQKIKSKDDILYRAFTYLCYLYLKRLNRSKLFCEQDKCISIVILDYDDKRFENLMTDFKFSDTINIRKGKPVISVDNIKMILINLTKIKENNHIYSKEIMEWLTFISNYKEESLMTTSNDKLKRALKLTAEIDADPELKYQLEREFKNHFYSMGFERQREEDLQIARDEAIKEGLEQGIEQGIINTAKKLLKNRIDINIIAESTGLSIDEIKNLKDCC